MHSTKFISLNEDGVFSRFVLMWFFSKAVRVVFFIETTSVSFHRNNN